MTALPRARRPPRGPGAHRAPGARQLLPRPPGLVHRARPGCRRVGHRRVHRTPRRVARDLAAQDGLYTLLVRGADGDRPRSCQPRRGLGRARRLAALLRPPRGRGGDHAPSPRRATGATTTADWTPGTGGRADIAALTAHGTDAEVVTTPGKLAPGSRCAARTAGPDSPWSPTTTFPTTAPWSRASSPTWRRPSTPTWPTGSPGTSPSSPPWSTGSPRAPPTTTAPRCGTCSEWTTPSRSPPSRTRVGAVRGVPAGRPRWEASGPGSSTTSSRSSNASCGCSTVPTR